MELSSLESIQAAMLVYTPPAPERGWGVELDVRSSHKIRSARCGCRRCPRCLEDARWERIFAEKFADPDYYRQLITRTSSPLTSL
jgi:hypothetical protein